MTGLLKVSDLFASEGFGVYRWHLCPGKDRKVLKIHVLVHFQSNQVFDKFYQCSNYGHLCTKH